MKQPSRAELPKLTASRSESSLSGRHKSSRKTTSRTDRPLRPTFRSLYALEAPDTGVPLPFWLVESSRASSSGGAGLDGASMHSNPSLGGDSVAERGLVSELNFRPSSAESLDRTQSAPPPARWWLHEPKSGMQSLGKGLFEVLTGMVVLRSSPSTEAETVGSLRAGTRFFGMPRQFEGGSVWLEVQARGATAPIFSLGPLPSDSIDASISLQMSQMKSSDKFGGNHPGDKFFRTSCRKPLVKPWLLDLAPKDGVWIEYNKQYIQRIRDIGRERGANNFSTLSLQIHSPKAGFKDRLRKRNPCSPEESDASSIGSF